MHHQLHNLCGHTGDGRIMPSSGESYRLNHHCFRFLPCTVWWTRWHRRHVFPCASQFQDHLWNGQPFNDGLWIANSHNSIKGHMWPCLVTTATSRMWHHKLVSPTCTVPVVQPIDEVALHLVKPGEWCIYGLFGNSRQGRWQKRYLALAMHDISKSTCIASMFFSATKLCIFPTVGSIVNQGVPWRNFHITEMTTYLSHTAIQLLITTVWKMSHVYPISFVNPYMTACMMNCRYMMPYFSHGTCLPKDGGHVWVWFNTFPFPWNRIFPSGPRNCFVDLLGLSLERSSFLNKCW